MELHNKIDREVLKQKIKADKVSRTTFSFYKYFHTDDPQALRDKLYLDWANWEVLGRVYIAYEGINAQVSIPTYLFEEFKQHMYTTYPALEGVRLNVAIEDDGKSFYKLKIKVRDKIVADGLNDDKFDVTQKGTYLDAEGFNRLTDQEDTLVVDMRNHYESEVGHFEGAVIPDVDTFRESLPIVVEMLKEHKDQPVVMYCTGGIRCEKASAYLRHKGFEHVYQLEGGIIEYARQVKSHGLENKFKGKNFVFDERLSERISDEVIAKCHQCGAPCDTHTNCSNEACNLLFIQCENCAEKYKGCCSDACRSFIELPIDTQKELRKGIKNLPRYYTKGRFELRTPFEVIYSLQADEEVS